MSGTGLDHPAGPEDLQLAAAAFLADNKDVRMLLRVLGRSLKETLGERVELAQGGSGLLHRSSPDVRAVTVRLDPDEYKAELDGDRVRCSVSRSSGGIRIRSEQLAVDKWLERLLGALQQEAASNQSAQAALQRVVLGGA